MRKLILALFAAVTLFGTAGLALANVDHYQGTREELRAFCTAHAGELRERPTKTICQTLTGETIVCRDSGKCSRQRYGGLFSQGSLTGDGAGVPAPMTGGSSTGGSSTGGGSGSGGGGGPFNPGTVGGGVSSGGVYAPSSTGGMSSGTVGGSGGGGGGGSSGGIDNPPTQQN